MNKNIEVRVIATATVEEVWTLCVRDDFDPSVVDYDCFGGIVSNPENVVSIETEEPYDERDRALIYVKEV